MAHPDPLLPADHQSIANQIAYLAPASFTEMELTNRKGGMGIPLSTWLIHSKDIKEGIGSFRDIVQFTGLWHTQVYVEGEAKLFCRCKRVAPNGNDWSVTQIWDGTIAPTLEVGLSFAEAKTGDPRVRVLEIPAYQTTALWLEDFNLDTVLVTSRPKSFEHLQLLTPYAAATFLSVIRKESPRTGIRF